MGGAFSETLPVRTAFPPAAKPAVSAPQAGFSSLQFSWSAPADTGGTAITAYKIRWAKAESPNSFLNANREHGVDIPGALTFSYTVTGLDSATTYAAQIAAVTTVPGEWSDAVTAVTRMFNADVNEFNGVHWSDGVIIARYLFGYRAHLQDGVEAKSFGPSDRAIMTTIQTGISSGELDVDGDGKTTGADAILFTRFLLGAEDESLTEGVADDSDRADIVRRMENLSLP